MSAAPQLDIFARPQNEERRREIQRLQERLEPIALTLADRRGPEGVTASDIIAEGITRGVLTLPPRGQQRALSWVGPWLVSLVRRRKLLPKIHHGTPVRRRSDRAVSHGNLQSVYVAPRFA